ncbi:helix-turn-helix domain-containing protein [uncultured Ruminococcus sp.]|uniref:helix-turn-helix domain-containing protein n=1 Tax=uncultured Ruminococcus sp. TaxID=165186 RepID=UPI0025DB98F7|nr:helix-turn-helix domain-containing protein [uncultured Ruminococcus sp.]
MDIGKLIHTRRTELNLTLEEIGNYVGVSKSTVKKWEDGYISNMKRDKIASLAKILKINPVALITGDNEDMKTNIHFKQNVESVLSISEKHLIQNYNKLNEKGKEKLLEYSEDLIGNKKYTEIEQKEKHA